jgi:hypothetical protein
LERILNLRVLFPFKDGDDLNVKTDSIFYGNAISVLCKQVVRAAKECIKNASFDMTKRGQVTALIGDNKYKVNIQGTEYILSCAAILTLDVMDTVYVLFPQNNLSDGFIIGKVASQ